MLSLNGQFMAIWKSYSMNSESELVTLSTHLGANVALCSESILILLSDVLLYIICGVFVFLAFPFHQLQIDILSHSMAQQISDMK